jgi:hypothetical protein
MKKTILVALVLTLLAPGVGRAEPDMLVGTKAAILSAARAVPLRNEPADTAESLCEVPTGAEVTVLAEAEGGYTRVNYEGRRGYVSSAALDYMVSLGGLSILASLTDAQRENIEGFLAAFIGTDFAELSQGAFLLTDESGPLLAAFAARYAVREGSDAVETGAYENGCDARLSAAALTPIVRRYFGAMPEPFGDGDGYFYFQTSDAQMTNRTAVLTNIIDFGSGAYALYFEILNADAKTVGTGRADVHASDLGDPDGFSLSALAVSD